MKDRGKRELETYINNGDCYEDQNIPGFPCKKHPSSYSSSSSIGGGICAYCLTDRLVQLVCSECGEQRLPFCSCSQQIPSSETGRISFLLENDVKIEQKPDLPPLKRSNSTCVVDVHKRRDRNRETESNSGTGFWKLGNLFRKKRGKKGNNFNNEESKSETGDCVVVSRSRSLCSFRGFYDSTEESGGSFPVSSSAARASSVSANYHIDSAKMSCFSESEARISNFDYYDASFAGGAKQSIFSVKESDFMSEDPGFIDLKLNETDTRKTEQRRAFGMSSSASTKEFEMFRNGGSSCRVSSSVRERELRKCRKTSKVWRWFFRHQSRKDDDHNFAFKS